MKTEFPVEQSEQAAKHNLELVVITSQSAYGGPDTASPEHASLFTSTSTAYPKTHPAATCKRLRRCWQHANTIVPGGIQGLDRYAYVGNSPVMYVDPTGHAPKQDPYWCVNERNPSQCRKDYYWQQRKIASNTITVLFCGWDGAPCGDGEDAALAPYDSSKAVYVDCTNLDGTQLTKEACYQKFVDDILPKYENRNFVFVGHSAGADVAILAANYLIDNNRGSQLLGLILLDPTLSAKIEGHAEYADPGGLMPMLMRIIKSNIPVFVGDSVGPTSDNAHDGDDPNGHYNTATRLLDPKTNPELNDYYSYNYHSANLSHMGLSTDLTIRDKALFFIRSYIWLSQNWLNHGH